jgi:hypothetical protein
MIFDTFDPDNDIVTGRSNQVSTGIWPNNALAITQSLMVSDFFDLTGSNANPSYGTNPYNILRTMYYLNVFPTETEHNNMDPYFSITYGNVNGNLGSGSFVSDMTSIQAHPSKAIYTQYSNLLANSDLFYMNSGSSVVIANDIWVISFSSFKMKDSVDAGVIQFSLSGSNGNFTFIDDSTYSSTVNTSYQIISLTNQPNPPNPPTYGGFGTFFPASGIIVLNASAIANLVGLNTGTYQYSPGLSNGFDYTINHYVLFNAINTSTMGMNVQCSEFVPYIQYYIRVKNKEFNYSNNPTFVYDGTDSVHPAGQIYNASFITNPQTYITTIGLYNDNNELIAVAKLSRPLIKSFSSEALIKVSINS